MIAMFRSFYNRYKNAWTNLRREIKPIIGFEIWFSLIFAVFPQIKIGLTVFQARRDFTQNTVDFLSIDAAQAASRLVKDAQQNGKQVHVWTVNDLQTALLMIEVGVDNIITDKPVAIQGWLQAWNDLTGTEKIALWLRNLFLQTTFEKITLWLRNLFLQDNTVLDTEPSP